MWQWLKHGARISNGQTVTDSLVREALARQCEKLESVVPARELRLAATLYEQMMTDPEFPEFLTLGAYQLLD